MPDRCEDPVVIVGLGVEAPGGIDTAEQYWSLLADGREALSAIPEDRDWAVRELIDGSHRDGFKPICNVGGFLSGAAEFDPGFFGIAPREAIAMDPQQRVALRVAWRACEDAGINPDELTGHDVGVYLGASVTGYGPDMAQFSAHSGHLLPGTALSVISGRVAYTLGLAGPALTVDTSCSSALSALHLAIQAIRTGDADMALAGGVCVMGSPGFFVEFSKQHALSDDGHCRPYSAAATGTVWAEGAGIFVLQRKSAAVRDRRHIYGEVLSSRLNQDGHTTGLLTPSGQAQQRLFRHALADADVHPGQVGMIEGHGTGTRVGDPVELRSLINVYGADTEPGAGPRLGSVKSNIGHTQAAAGALGLAKVLLAAEHQMIPPTLHVRDGWHDGIDWDGGDGGGITLAETITAWPARDGHRIGSVSAFGMSGTNAHVIVAVDDAEMAPSC
ncbi:polyketide synthase [Mycolicibacter terrae]|uniref:Polyketide synthase n=1 Tax=Mycolicibacter terrae TaxID=1788 RepID=A0AAD1MG58_9MYCO|nr:polyketide synthase [Mycolicibacter terrae]ORW96416.1 beta-ketoacyl synthase [Mycolicibacter terrae]BBX23202.1 polyketide synthase [Mycolicibacter terrae]SNV66578.1 polyketide synthase [Mycolicibacter terrae]